MTRKFVFHIKWTFMLDLKPNYVTDSSNNKIAVQLSFKTFKKIEDTLENYGLYKLMEDKSDEPLNLEEAHAYNEKLKKKK